MAGGGPEAVSRRRLAESGPIWFAVSAVASLAGVWLSEKTLVRYTNPPPGGGFFFVLTGLALIFLAGYAAWKLAQTGVYS